MADLSVLTMKLRWTVLGSAVLVEIEPESSKGLTFIVPLDELVDGLIDDDDAGEEWKSGGGYG